MYSFPIAGLKNTCVFHLPCWRPGFESHFELGGAWPAPVYESGPVPPEKSTPVLSVCPVTDKDSLYIDPLY